MSDPDGPSLPWIVTTALDRRATAAQAAPTFTIRQGEPDDMKALRDVFRRSSLSNESDRARLLANPDALELDDVPIRENKTWVAVTGSNVIVGFATAMPTANGVELEDLFVDPDWMRQGVGRALVLDVVEAARAAHAERINVTANGDALDFYASAGFVRDGDVDTRFGPAMRLHRDVNRDVNRDVT